MSNSLLSLAIVRANWERHKQDRVDNFVPLVGTLVIEKQYASINGDTLAEVCTDFKNKYGLWIPTHALVTIIRRMTKYQMLVKAEDTWKPDFEKLEELNLADKSAEIEREFGYLLDQLQLYIKNATEEESSRTEIEKGLIAFLQEHDLDILFGTQNQRLLPQVKKNKKLAYLIGQFIKHASESEPKSFKYLIDITIGHALAATLLYEDFTVFQGKLKNLDIYFDTPWLFELIGVGGIAKQNMAKELLSMLKQEQANLHILDINQGEVLSNLEVCKKEFERESKGDTAGMTYKSCKLNDFTESDVDRFILKLDDLLFDVYGLSLATVPDHNANKEFQIDVEELYDIIVSTYTNGFTKSKKESEAKETKNSHDNVDSNTSKKQTKTETTERDNSTIWRDVDSLSGMYRARKGFAPKKLKDCKALFITTNSSLAKASRIFEKKQNNVNHSIPTCITDSFLGTLIWLGTPAKAEEIAGKKLIANGYALIEPSDELIRKYLKEVEKLKSQAAITEDEHLLLRTHHSAFTILNSKTYGDVNQFGKDTTKEILAQIIENIKIDAELSLQGEIETAKEKAKDEENARISEEAKHADTRRQLAELKEGSSTLLNRLENNLTYVVSFIVKLLLWMVAAGIIYLVIGLDSDSFFNNPIAKVFAIVLLASFTAANLVFGFFLSKYVDMMVKNTTDWLHKQLFKG